MNKYNVLINELCKRGDLEEFREAITEIFLIIKENPCQISCDYRKGEPSKCEFTKDEPPRIYIAITDRRRPLVILWDMLHEYGHFLSGKRQENDTDMDRELLAWKYATEIYIKLPRLLWHADDFQAYMAECVHSYLLKALAEHQKTKKFDIRAFLTKEMPSLIDLLAGQNISWTSFNKSLQDHLIGVAEKMAQKGAPVDSEVNFQSVVVGKIEGNPKAVAMFNFFESTFKSLNEKLDMNEKKLLHPILSQLLSNINKDYLHFISELAVLNKYISTGQYQFIKVEEIILPGKNVTADFLFKNKSHGNELLLEVVNVRLEAIDASDNNFAGFERNLHLKFLEKTGKKLINPDRFIQLQPVIWYSDHEQLKLISDFFIEKNYSYENVLIPLCYASMRESNGNYVHKFENINTIFDTHDYS